MIFFTASILKQVLEPRFVRIRFSISGLCSMNQDLVGDRNPSFFRSMIEEGRYSLANCLWMILLRLELNLYRLSMDSINAIKSLSKNGTLHSILKCIVSLSVYINKSSGSEVRKS